MNTFYKGVKTRAYDSTKEEYLSHLEDSKKLARNGGAVAHACNPSTLGG